MSRSFKKKQFDTIIKGVHYFLRYATGALYVFIGILLVGFFVLIFIPKGVFDYNLANLEHVNINILNATYNFGNSLTGIINVKWLAILGSLMAITNLAFLQYVLVLLKKVIGDVKQEKPFSEQNITRLKYVGYGYFVAAVLIPLVNGIAFITLVDLVGLFDAGYNFSIEFSYLFMGFIILILAGIFEYGAYLQEDHDMTV